MYVDLQCIPILVAKIWRRNLDYAKNLQVKYFTGEKYACIMFVLMCTKK